MSDHIPNPPRIFISYSRQDGEDFATDLRQRLERDYPDLTLWQDRAQMEGGVGWWSQIEDALRHVAYMVLIATPQAMASPIVAKEWRTARQQGVCIYPVQVPGLPLKFDTLPRWMRDVHFYDLDHEWETFIGHLRSPCQQARVPFMAQDVPPHFVERPTEFNALIDLLRDDARTEPIAITTALHGAGGFGKTTLAAALCHHEDVITAFDDGILWVTLGESPDVIGGLTKLYAALTGERPGFVDVEDAAKALAEQLADKDCLIVLDDVWNTAHLRPFLRGGERCARLITTRNFQIAVEADAAQINVDEMTRAESIQMLVRGITPPPADRTPWAALAQRLGEWPLLLEIANGLLRKRQERGATPDQAVEWVNRALEKHGVLGIVRTDDIARKQGAAGTLTVSLDLLDEIAQQRYLELAIFPEDVAIPLTTPAALWGGDEFDVEELVERFADLSLLRWDMQGGTIRLHDVIREYLVLQVGDAAPALHARLLDAWGDMVALPDAYAWQYVAYHLMAAERGTDLRALLLDYGWLRAKLDATNSAALIADYDYLLPGDEALRLVQSAIRLSAHKLAYGNEHLGPQLLGRLLAAEQDDIRALLAAIEAQMERPWLRPLHPTLTQAGGPLLRILEGHTRQVDAVAVLPADDHGPTRIVSGSTDKTVRIWDAASGACLLTLEDHSEEISAVAVLPADDHNPTRIVSGSWDHTVRIWDAASGVCLHTLEGHAAPVTAVAVLPAENHDPARIVSGARDHTVRIWDVASGACLLTLHGHSLPVTTVAVLPADTAGGESSVGHVRIVSGGDDKTLRIWDATSGDCLLTLHGHESWVNTVAVLPTDAHGSARIVSGSSDNTVRIWDATSGDCLLALHGHTLPVNAVAVLPADVHGPIRIVSGSSDNTVHIWDATSGDCLLALRGHKSWVNTVAALPAETADGEPSGGPARIVSASRDTTVCIWDTASSGDQQILPGYTKSVSAVAVLPADAANSESTGGPVQVVSGSQDNTVRIWDSTTGDCLRTLEGHMATVNAVAILPANAVNDEPSVGPIRIVSGSSDNTVRIWNAVTGDCLLILEDHTSAVTTVAVLPAVATTSEPSGGAAHLVSGSSDSTVRLWDTTTGDCLLTLRGHSAAVTAVAMLPADAHSPVCAVSASSDITVQVWDTVTSARLRTLEGHTTSVIAVAVLPASVHGPARIVSGSTDTTVRIWDAASGACLNTLYGHTSVVWGVTALPQPDGTSRVISASSDRTLRVWHPVTGECEAIFHADARLLCCATGPDGLIVAGDAGGAIHYLRYEV